MTTPALPTLRLVAAPDTAPGRKPNLPAAILSPGSRGDSSQTCDSLLSNVEVEESWEIGPRARGDDSRQVEVKPDARLLALESEDGTTVFIRADALAERLARLTATRPELSLAEDNSLDLTALHPRDAQSRGVGEWVWRTLSTLVVKEDEITGKARDKLAELTGSVVEDLIVAGGTHAGAKAIVWAIEKQGRNAPGLYPWDGGAIDAQAPLSDKAPAITSLASKPGLIFIHGTGSHTLGSFGQLPGSQIWSKLDSQFEGRLFGFEHHTFSESPIDNALALARALPKQAQFSIVSHSRGGLVGDLLCIDTSIDHTETLNALILDYRPAPRKDDALESALESGQDGFIKQEQAKLGELVKLLRAKRFKIDRYVRVACPARGTALLSDNLEVFLSGLLSLIRKASGWAAGAVVGAASGPIAGAKAKAVTDKGIAVLTRIVIEIANRRLDPRLLPGIEAMLPDAAMGMLLASAPYRSTTAMAIIAGDIEGGGFAKRLGTMFTDWMFFDRADNDLVVDTASMYGGLAWKAKAQAIFVQGENVNHFRYFRDDTATADGYALPTAMHRWLSAAEPFKLPEWSASAAPELDLQGSAPASRNGAKAPILVFLPGIMGSHLNAEGSRVWLDPLGLARGALSRITMDSPKVSPDGLVGMAYGKLVERLGKTHEVKLFPYDWRQPIQTLGEQFAEWLAALLKNHADAPIRILAHSMGGLVVRAAIAHDPTLWDAIVARPEGRLVMLGTPNQGAHLFVHTLLGQSDTIRLLARVDLRHRMQHILDIIAGFPGAIHLLPAPGQADTFDYYKENTWTDLAAHNNDFWFGSELGGKPKQAVLDEAKAFWEKVADTEWVRKAPDRIAYIYGQSNNTPCGIIKQKGEGSIVLRGTPAGDGSVTWASGHLPGLPANRSWLMPVDHMGLTSTETHFEEIESLLAHGTPRKLGPLPVSRGGDANVVREYRAGPPEGFPSPPEATTRLLGGHLRPEVPRSRNRRLKVSVSAMDLRFVHTPVLCGHYRGDPIAAAEGVIDRYLVQGALSQRQRLGIHTGEIGNASIVLMPRNAAERHRQTGRGAVVVGLGEMGRLTAGGVTEAVRGGVLRYLLHAADRYGEEQATTQSDNPPTGGDTLHLKLASLLIGTNSALQLDVRESVKAVVLGVLLANRDFANGDGSPNGDSKTRRALVSELQFIEVFHDSAISAAHAVSQLGSTLKSELRQMNFQLDAAEELSTGEGARQRLSVSPFSDYWPRLMVSDADREEADCPPDCSTPRFQPPIPPENLRQLLRIYGCGDKTPDGSLPTPFWLDGAPTTHYAGRLKFIYMGDKARAESIVQIRQPGLVEKLCDDRLKSRSPTLYSRGLDFGATLFQLLVPLEFKAAARQAGNLLLMVDETTANLPWEMLEVDGSPMVLQTRVVRQFITTRFRRQVARTDNLSACVISEPSTEGFHAQFGGADWKPRIGGDGKPEPDCLPPLPGAVAEGMTVSRVLSDAGYQVTEAPPDSLAADIFTRLFARPYRLLMISAHGIHARRAADGSHRSGVVLSNGLLLTASEIGQMESVPDLVFLNCCELGKIGTGGSKLAASLARELIDIGVRCVVAAGWEVNDGAARTFIETFFEQMAEQGASFGEAISTARAVCFEAHPGHNTWGAYQAYGDPAFQLKVHRNPAKDDAPLRSSHELIDWIEQRRIECRLPDAGQMFQSAGKGDGFKQIARRIQTRLRHVPEGWISLPEVQQTLGRLYAAYGLEGFDEARKAWLRAISEDSSRGLVPLSAIEQLANLEARQAENLSRTPDAPDALQAAALADSALARLRFLIALSADHPKAASGTLGSINPERLAILGSTLKRKAVVLARSGKRWSDVVAPLLTEARDAYAQHQGTPDSAPNWNPYNYLNRLQIDALLDTEADYSKDAASCDDAAQTRFGRTFDFFDAVMSADARLACWLHTAEGSARELACNYLEAVRGITVTPRELDSVTAQIRILGDLLKCRGDTDRARLLDTVIGILHDPKQASEAPGNGAPTETPAAAKPKAMKTAAGTPKAGAGKKKKN
ncbi:CHAT domain-containing protein [Zoogloea sp.]|uniref:CHAT domain-containing protein n=1 Tax=Zoogloea sp. TaxID=49181 RepID=UPI0035B32CB9